jgi:hypothetical protein
VIAGTVSFRDGRMSQGKLLPERAVSAKGGSAVERKGGFLKGGARPIFRTAETGICRGW